MRSTKHIQRQLPHTQETPYTYLHVLAIAPRITTRHEAVPVRLIH